MHNSTGLIAPFLTHYRINFYRKLSDGLSSGIVFFFQQKVENDGRPGIRFDENDHFLAYKIRKLKLGSITISFSFDLLRKIRKKKLKILIIEGAISNLTSWYFVFFRKIFKIKVIAWACGWQPATHSGVIRNAKRKLEKFFFNNCDWIISYSTTAETYFRSIGVRSGIDVAYNGIDTDQYVNNSFQILDNAKHIRANHTGTIFLYVGGIFKDKNVGFMVDCFHDFSTNNRDAILWIIGDGPDKKSLEEHVKEKRVENIVFWGRKESDVDQYFAAADFFILPGVGGLALNQAMLWGTPCIVSEADGTENDLVVEGETGFRFTSASKDSLVFALKRAVDLPVNLKKGMSFRASELILNRSNTTIMATTFSEVIGKVGNIM